MKVVVAGGTGYLGTALCRSLVSAGEEVVVLSRSGPRARLVSGVRGVAWDGRTIEAWVSEINGADVVVNLTGESIGAKRWTQRRKQVLRQSRLEPTAALVSAMGQVARRPRTFLCASGVNYYGSRGDDIVTEKDPPGQDFLAGLVLDWEAEARKAGDLGVRVGIMRHAVVLGPGGETLPRLTLPFRFFVGGPIGSGMQWMSWVYIDDLVGLYEFAIHHDDVVGPVNVAAPEPARNRDLAATMGRVLGSPSWMPVPGFALRLVFGELAETFLLGGQRVVPAAAQRFGYTFREPTLQPALRRALRPA